jgi:type II secretory pathway component GspD/PulD (secretin)
MIRLLAIAILGFALAAQAQAPRPAAEQRISLNFRATPIEEIFDVLSRRDGTNIILTRGVTGNISVNLYNVTVRDAIHRVAQAAGYLVEERNGDYIIHSRETSPDVLGATQIKTFKVQYSDVKQVADIVSKYVSRNGKVTPLIGRRLIVVEDLPGFADRVGKLLEELDVPPRQVLIEAKILEVILDDSERFGINWRQVFGAPGDSASGSLGTAGLASGSPTAPATGFFFSVIVNQRLDAFFTALASKGRVRTLATPKLLALENQEAKTVIGDSTGYRVTTTINLVTTETIQFLESGVILKVTPSVDQRGRVLMRVHPEVSSATLADGIPSKKSTEVTTELVCEDGQSIFIGGLIKNSSLRERDGVPGLMNIPVLGALFRGITESTNYTETIVVITPHIVADPRQASGFTEEHLRRLQEHSNVILEHRREFQDPDLP